ncbi:MAG TPA: glycosyltransferase N-terminal domain-containing protein, partial [Hyphomonadaceae bacterium]|nr:glycosyltransferase N-terminal domain-containing protein [Hyphomonadaceae bacterium]
MTASLSLYQFGTRLLEPLAPWLVEQRLKKGKEHPDRVSERLGLTQAPRAAGPLIWMHGASVGESRLLLDVFGALLKQRPDVHAVVTTQTLTSADMIAAWSPRNVVHQMAPVDGPGAVERFLAHWRPDAAVFAEGEIWPNMLTALKARRTPAALINARMTGQTLKSWRGRPASARELFSTFVFIGAADQATADGLRLATGRSVEVVGNLKSAAAVEPPSVESVEAFHAATQRRPILLAASTHPGEEEFALDTFKAMGKPVNGTLLIVTPRHPDRGESIAALASAHGFKVEQRSRSKSAPARETDVLVADTIGELMFWYAVSDGIYLGGATAEGIGGHNPIEPAQLGKRVFTGPNGFNFR